MVRLDPSGREDVYDWRVNPEMLIPREATAIHGISDLDVARAPTFAQLAPQLADLLTGTDLGGYNARRFDVPMLECEFARAGIQPAPFDGALVVDAQEIFFNREPRTLSGAVRFYCNDTHTGAHGARSDAVATLRVLRSQLERYSDLPRDLDGLIKVVGPKERFVDPTRRLKIDDQGDVVINFGTHRGEKLIEIVKTNRSYLQWMMSGDWHPKVIEALRVVLSEQT
jgi:DNA polymerase-3 subunit epsilon